MHNYKKSDVSTPLFMVVPGRIELPTPAFSVPCSTY